MRDVHTQPVVAVDLHQSFAVSSVPSELVRTLRLTDATGTLADDDLLVECMAMHDSEIRCRKAVACRAGRSSRCAADHFFEALMSRAALLGPAWCKVESPIADC